MITRKTLLLSTALGFSLLLAGCATSAPESPATLGAPSASNSAGVKSAPVSTPTTSAPAAPTDSDSAQAGDISTGGDIQTPTTGGDDQRAAELVVMSYFDNLLTGNLQGAQRLITPQSSTASEESAVFAKRIIQEKLVSYRVSGTEINPKNGESIIRVHYSTKANPGDNVTELGADEDELESEWFVSTMKPEAFR